MGEVLSPLPKEEEIAWVPFAGADSKWVWSTFPHQTAANGSGDILKPD